MHLYSWGWRFTEIDEKNPLREERNEGDLVGGKAMLASSKRVVVAKLANLLRPFNDKCPLKDWLNSRF